MRDIFFAVGTREERKRVKDQVRKEKKERNERDEKADWKKEDNGANEGKGKKMNLYYLYQQESSTGGLWHKKIIFMYKKKSFIKI